MGLLLVLANVLAAYLAGAFVMAWIYGWLAHKRPALLIDSASVAWFAVLWPLIGLTLVVAGLPIGLWELLRWVGKRAGAQ